VAREIRARPLDRGAHDVRRPDCSVVVCTRYRAELLARCLGSLVQLEHPSYELIVVDNTRGDREVERVAADSGARYIVDSHSGLSRARNTGGRAADGRIIAYLDDDAVAEPAWLSRHTAAFEDPDLMATTGRILPVSLDAPAARVYEAAGGVDLGEVPSRVNRSTPGWFEIANFGGVGVGSNMAFRRELFEGGWGFRESLGPGAGIPGEEHYAFFTIIRAGHAIAYVPDAIVYHEYPRTASALERRRYRILRGGVAYMVMLLVEEPEFRHDTMQYMWEAVHGTRRVWRRGDASERLGNRVQLLAAVLAGVPLYLRARLTNGERFSAPRVPVPTAEPEPQRRSVSN
jgi:cellulose synthase/poly-beta-1,6-N-acetylglucosamine synthase-like glycosyltransferase